VPDAEKPQDSIYLPTDATPEQLFRAIGKLRKDARDEIDRLLRFLDETDNHMEREPDETRTATLPNRHLAASGTCTTTKRVGRRAIGATSS
jgi:hypothetical protein